MLLKKRPKSTKRPYLIVQGLIYKNTGEYLAIKRGEEPEIGTWEFPGGKVDPGETIENALQREIKEETGLKVDLERFVGWGQAFGIKAPDGTLADRFVMFFEAKLITGKLKFDHETADHKWVTLEQMMEFKPLSKPASDFFGKFQLIPNQLSDKKGAVIR